MSRRLSRATQILACALLWFPPERAEAKVPDPRFSSVSTSLVGSPSGEPIATMMVAGFGGTPIRVQGFCVEVREVNNAPLAFELVTLDFSATPVRLLADDRPGVTVDCGTRTIRALTDRMGIATFAPRFSGSTAGTRVIVQVDGVHLREVEACSTDIDGDGQTGITDFARFARSFGAGELDPTTDFAACDGAPAGTTTLADFVVFAREVLRDAHGTACP